MKKKLTRGKIILIVVVAIVFTLVASIYGYYLYLESLFTEGKAGVLPENIKTEQPNVNQTNESQLNLLICGIDYEPEGAEQYSDPIGKTDVILYVNIVTDKDGTVSANVLQIPRDTYIGTDITSTGKLNVLFREGIDKTNRIANLATQINKDFALPIDHYVTLDMAAFKDIIDVMGGIEMYVPWDVIDGKGNKLEQGSYKFNGTDAMWVVQQRMMYAQKDFKRLEMQQYFYKAVFQKLRNDFNIAEAPLMAHKIAHYTNTNLTLTQAASMCLKLLNISDDNIFIVRAPGGSINVPIPNTSRVESVYGINAERLAPVLNEHFRAQGQQVPASELGILTGFTYTLGETFDEGKYLGDM